MPMLAELVDAVVGVDTHRDTHDVEIALPTGTPVATCQVSNDSTGYAELLAWIVDHAPGPRLAVSIEGTRSYGVGLARAAAAAGLIVVECEQPDRKARCGKGKSEVRPERRTPGRTAALRLDADRLPRASQRRPSDRVVLTPWAVPKRRGLRRVGRCQPAAGQQRAGRATPARPRRRPSAQPGDRDVADAVLPTTKAYVARRIAEGKTDREIRRCLKRYIARQLHRTLTAAMILDKP
nr:IS110 family transposase [Pseudonocardia sp. MH-G8]